MKISCPSCGASFKVKPEVLGPKGRKVKCSKCDHRWHATLDDGDDMDDAEAPVRPKAKAKPKAKPKPKPKAPPPAPDDDDDDDFAADAPPPPPPPPPIPGFDDEDDDEDDDDFDKESSEKPERGRFDEMPQRPPADYEAPPIPPESRFQPQPTPKKKGGWKGWVALLVLLLVVGGVGFFYRDRLVEAYPPLNKIYMMAGMPADIPGVGLQLSQPEPRTEFRDGRAVIMLSGAITNTTGDVVDVPPLKGQLIDSNQNELKAWAFKATEERLLPGESVRYTTEIANPPRGATSVSIVFARPEEVAALMQNDGGAMAAPGAESMAAPPSAPGEGQPQAGAN